MSIPNTECVNCLKGAVVLPNIPRPKPICPTCPTGPTGASAGTRETGADRCFANWLTDQTGFLDQPDLIAEKQSGLAAFKPGENAL